MRIAHLSDIHFRGRQRHDEYRAVFEEFAENAKLNKVDHIFVGGDIFHTKTMGISPEYIDVLTWWLKLLSSVAPLHLTLGNHDGNLVNSLRQDAVSPIVNALNHPNVFLYKDSGVYEFAPGYNWCVYSLFDVENWSAVKPVPGAVNIACYHGPVVGSRSETDWEIDSGMSVKDFEQYDLCMLGDIHRLQFLGTREVEIEIDEGDLEHYEGAQIIG